MNKTNRHQRNLSENSEAEDPFDFDTKKITPPKLSNAKSAKRSTFGDLNFFNITPGNTANMDDGEERNLAPALLTKTPLAEAPKAPTPKTPANKGVRKPPTLGKRKTSEDAETPMKLAKLDIDDAFQTPKATPAPRSSVKRKLVKLDEDLSNLNVQEQVNNNASTANEEESTAESGRRPRRSAAIKAAAAITLGSTPQTSSYTTPKAKPLPKSRAKKEGAKNDKEKLSEDSTKLDEEEKEDNFDKIFDTIQFILTSANRDSSPRTFAKKDVRKQIEARGGNVLETFEAMNPELTTYLIADTFYRTHKYLTALSLSVPTVSFKWINKCVEENKLVDYNDFMLDAGESETTGEVYKWKPLKGKLLAGKKVAVYSRREVRGIGFCQIWGPMVANLGAELVYGYPPETEEAVEFFKKKNTIDYFVADDLTTPQDLVNAVIEGGAVAVTSEWVIKAIITGSVASTTESEPYILQSKQ